MARALWQGAISFGLVHIPVALHTAVQAHELDLSMLDRRDFAPIGFRRYNKHTGKEVAWEDIVKGYQTGDGDYVVLSEEDLRQANPAATQTIAIEAFVPADSIPLIYYDTPYFLAPGRGGDKVFALLRDTLQRAGKVAIATVVIRTRQHLCALVAVGACIVLNTLRYAAELRSPEDLKLPDQAGVSEKEMRMALSLVEEMSEEWNPLAYHDSYRDDVLKLVEQKVAAGQTHTLTAPSARRAPGGGGNVVDLVALLKESLQKPGKAAPARRQRGSGSGSGSSSSSSSSSSSGNASSGGKATGKRGKAA